MRISDWSSDVCSSDLRRVGVEGQREFDRRVMELGDRGKRHAQRRRHAAERQADGEAVVLDLQVPEAVLDDERQDRQSVVSGTSVSVRVDLGGRRIIKKKIQYIDTQPHTSTQKF